jgi:hypothetical protein
MPSPRAPSSSHSRAVAAFEAARGFQLFPFQRDAIEAIEAGRSVIVSAPTGAGKTVVAEYAIERALELSRRAIYTSPVKALSNQKYRDFQERYGNRIGIMTGDVTIEPDAPILIMTTEIFRNTIFEDASKVRGVSPRDHGRSPLHRRQRSGHGVGREPAVRPERNPLRRSVGHDLQSRGSFAPGWKKSGRTRSFSCRPTNGQYR